MKKLSVTMLRALRAINASGGHAVAEGGGWWKGSDGKRLTIEPVGHSLRTDVGTITIYALEDRGLLRRCFKPGAPSHRDTRIITEAGRAAVGQKEDSSS